MSYYLNKTLNERNFEKVVAMVTEELKKEGFGVITEIDVRETMKKKLNVDFYKYRILGACNPHFAHQALLLEDKIGVMLPCNVIVQEKKPGAIEVSAVDPAASMMRVDNERLKSVAVEVRQKLQKVIENLS